MPMPYEEKYFRLAPKLRELETQGSLAQALATYLESRKALPRIGEAFMDLDKKGTYAFGGEAGPTIALNRSWHLQGDDAKEVYTHELAHAADSVMGHEAISADRGGWFRQPRHSQYQDALYKLVYNPLTRTNPRRDLVDALKVRKGAPGEGYRLSVDEVPGWAAGAHSGIKGPTEDPKPHLDATLATELAILLELAGRAQKAKP